MDKRTIQKEDLFKLQFLQSGQLSPYGSQVVYGVSTIDAEKDDETVALWLMDVASGEKRQLTNSKGRDDNPQWSPDGKWIAFTSTRSDSNQIYRIAPDGGEAHALTDLKQGVGGGPVWSPDGKQIAFTAGKATEEPYDPAKPYRHKRKFYRFDGIGNVDLAVQNVLVMPADGGEPTQLTDDDHLNTMPKWSPDGKEILYSVNFPPDSPRNLPGLRIVTIETKAQRDVVWGWGVAQIGEWQPDGQRIAFIGQPHGQLMGYKDDLYAISASGESIPDNRTPDLKVGVGGGLQPDMPSNLFWSGQFCVSSDGKFAHVAVQEGGCVGIYQVVLDGEINWEPIIEGTRYCRLLGVSERHILFAGSTFNDPVQLFITDIEGGNEQQLTTLNAEVLNDITMPDVEHVLYPSKDGTQIEGWVMKPPVGEAPYPTILYIHGGPWGAFGHVFSFDFQMLAGAGYAVFFDNYRGSSGYGTDFGTAIQSAWGSLDYEDHMAGLDYLIDNGTADADRLGVCGLSAGGFGSCWIVGQTDRFKAAVPENPVTNLMSMYGVGDIGNIIVRLMGGKPHEVMETYVKWSPITYAHRCNTPTLLIQSNDDHRCPPEQAEQFYTVLHDNGCPVEMVRIPNSSHIGAIAGPLAGRRAHNDALLDWMNRYILGKEPDTTII